MKRKINRKGMSSDDFMNSDDYGGGSSFAGGSSPPLDEGEMIEDMWQTEIGDIMMETGDKMIPVFIEGDVNNTIISFNLDGLDPTYIYGLDIDPEEPLQLKVRKIADDIEILEIKNAGILRYPIERSTKSSLTTIVNSVIQWINNPGKWCPNCGKEFTISGTKPIPCENALCRFVASEMGNFFDLYEIFLKNKDLIDLSVALLFTAVVNHRREDIVNPFPEGFLEEGVKDWTGLTKALESIPSMTQIETEINSINADDRISQKSLALENYLRGFHLKIPYLIRWLLGTIRSHLIFLERGSNEEAFTETGDKFRYLFRMISDTPERSALFDRTAKTDSIIQGFHGSPAENWHSILRHSLQNYSGSKGQLHGAVFGAGIYMAPTFEISSTYSKTAINCPLSRFNSLKLMIVAEIINNTDVKTIDRKQVSNSVAFTGNIFCYVVKNEINIRVKYLGLY